MLSTLILLLILSSGSALGCFGPKLFIGTAPGLQQRALFELVSLYIKEKTGTESVRVELQQQDPVTEVHEARLDLVFLPVGQFADLTPVLEYPQLPVLVAGPRPLEALQFAMVRPALDKLQRQLPQAALDRLLQQVANGQPPAAAARQLLTELELI